MLAVTDRITTKRQLKEWLEYELAKYGTKKYVWYPISEYDVLRKHIILLRKTEYYQNTNKKIRGLIYRVMLLRMQNKYGIHIPINCCGKGLKIMHVGPVLMNGKVTVGCDCSFHINTALVAGGPDDGVPKIGNNVVVGIGAVIVGSVEIADYTAIGANAVVNKNVDEENVCVAGVPAKIISKQGQKSWK